MEIGFRVRWSAYPSINIWVEVNGLRYHATMPMRKRGEDIDMQGTLTRAMTFIKEEIASGRIGEWEVWNIVMSAYVNGNKLAEKVGWR